MPKPKELEERICSCGEKIKIVETPIVGGPNKGKLIQYAIGCKCEDKALAKEAWENHQNAKKRWILANFDVQSFIPPKLKKARFETFKPQSEEQVEVFKAMVEFAREFDPANEGKSIILAGDYGTGKSHLCVAAVKMIMEKGHTAIFCDVPQMFTKIKATFKDKEMTEAGILDAFKSVDILVLDDIGAESMTDWRMETLLQIINSRAGKHTLYTTNLNRQEMREHLGERNWSKFNDSLTSYKLRGKDMRMK